MSLLKAEGHPAGDGGERPPVVVDRPDGVARVDVILHQDADSVDLFGSDGQDDHDCRVAEQSEVEVEGPKRADRRGSGDPTPVGWPTP